jgi:hypothetical protein
MVLVHAVLDDTLALLVIAPDAVEVAAIVLPMLAFTPTLLVKVPTPVIGLPAATLAVKLALTPSVPAKADVPGIVETVSVGMMAVPKNANAATVGHCCTPLRRALFNNPPCSELKGNRQKLAIYYLY